MRALLSTRSGGPETLQITDVPQRDPGPGELRIRVAACSINYPDALIIEDRYQFRPERPFAPGSEIAGIVDAVGDGVTDWRPGDRLIAGTIHGGLAESVVVRAEMAFRLPDGFSLEEGSALLMTYATTIHALIDRAKLKPGEALLVLGAAGGVGLAAIEIGKALGARTIAAVSSEEKARAARAAGADDVIIYGRGPFDKDAARRLSDAFKGAVGPNGADVIYDPVGGDYAEPALRAIAWEGRYLVVGFPAGIPRIALNLPLLKSCDICGVFWGGFMERSPQRNRDHVDQLFRWWGEGRIRPRIDRIFPLERGGEAISWVSGRSAIGKVVVTMTEDRPVA